MQRIIHKKAVDIKLLGWGWWEDDQASDIAN